MVAGSAKPSKGSTYLYTYYDRNGNVVINNLPPGFMQGQGLTLKHVGVGHIRLAMSKQEMARVLRSPELLSLVDEIATSVGVDPFLARAIIQAESAFNYKARSRAGALGLMQLMPATAERFGVVDPFDPRQNISGGTKYLRWLLDYYKGDVTRTVAAYNAGEGAVDRHKGIPPFRETRAYVPRVMDLYARKLVQPDPKAAGAMELLKKGHGGFALEETKVKPTLAKQVEPQEPPSERRTTALFQWVDANGRLQISDQPPPRGTKGVKVFGGAAN
ncbi:MAG: transglycosylase SLT domain-containing protein [Holophaga sp.]|nr:transglycosylase SLT domain-containing protein [Holophaga sp.]